MFVHADKFGFTFVVAVGKSKKLAKRNAAQAMIQRILQGGVTPQVQPDVSEEFDEETIPLVIDPLFLTQSEGCIEFLMTSSVFYRDQMSLSYT